MKKIALLASAAALTLGTALLAGGHSDENPAVVARQAHMQLYQHNLVILGGMAQGQIEYDAESAMTAAKNLVTLNNVDQRSYWMPGTDSESVEGSRTLPALWENFDRAMVITGEFEAAVNAMGDAAGTDLASLQAAMGPLGGACSACHREFRVRNN